MAKARNMVIAGDYVNKGITYNGKDLLLVTGFMKTLKLDKSTIASYELTNSDSSKSVSSGIVRGIVGGAVFGAAGLIAGAASGKNNNIYQVTVEFIDGKRSLIEIDKSKYDVLIQKMF